jgi:tRNA pseudouridine32 synthase / 23S rRNA pseudouridine746 synthase
VFYPPCRGKCGVILPRMLQLQPLAQSVPIISVSLSSTKIRDNLSCSLSIVFRDERLLIVDKPSGFLSIPGRGPTNFDSVQTRIQNELGIATAVVAHRLDQDTSGLIIVALDAATLAAMHQLFARGDVTKHYLAILDGKLPSLAPGTSGRIDLPLRPDHYDRPRQVVDIALGKKARTEWTVVSVAETTTRVLLTPHSGRTHQLRVHCAHLDGLGLAIVGDRLYGRGTNRLMLHATVLRFTHPWTGELLNFESSAPF